jgi:hypothetical protein
VFFSGWVQNPKNGFLGYRTHKGNNPKHKMTTPAPKINIEGFVKSMTTKGFTPEHSLSEFIDNALDAGATKVKLHLYCGEVSPLTGVNEPFLVCSDNGRGMDFAKLDDCLTVHNISDASDAKNGLYGVGLTHGLATISNQEGESVILSNTNSCSTNEMRVNWSKVLESRTWNPCASDMTVKYHQATNTYGIPGAVSGTVLLTSVNSSINNNILASSTEIINELRVKYAEYLKNGVNITMKFGTDDEVSLIPIDPLNVEVAQSDAESKYMRTTIKVRKYGVLYRAYYNDRGNWVRLTEDPTLTQSKLYKAKKVSMTEDVDGEDVCEMTFESSYVPSTLDTEGIGGATHLKRCRKIIARHQNEPVSGGTFGVGGASTVKREANHMLSYGVNADRLIKTECNKSKIESANVELCLQVMMRYLKDVFYKKYAEDHQENKTVRDRLNASQNAILQTVKSMIKNEAYIAELKALNDKFISSLA